MNIRTVVPIGCTCVIAKNAAGGLETHVISNSPTILGKKKQQLKLENSHFPVLKLLIAYNNQESVVLT